MNFSQKPLGGNRWRLWILDSKKLYQRTNTIVQPSNITLAHCYYFLLERSVFLFCSIQSQPSFFFVVQSIFCFKTFVCRYDICSLWISFERWTILLFLNYSLILSTLNLFLFINFVYSLVAVVVVVLFAILLLYLAVSIFICGMHSCVCVCVSCKNTVLSLETASQTCTHLLITCWWFQHSWEFFRHFQYIQMWHIKWMRAFRLIALVWCFGWVHWWKILNDSWKWIHLKQRQIMDWAKKKKAIIMVVVGDNFNYCK